jgi:hypothetical protein
VVSKTAAGSAGCSHENWRPLTGEPWKGAHCAASRQRKAPLLQLIVAVLVHCRERITAGLGEVEHASRSGNAPTVDFGSFPRLTLDSAWKFSKSILLVSLSPSRCQRHRPLKHQREVSPAHILFFTTYIPNSGALTKTVRASVCAQFKNVASAVPDNASRRPNLLPPSPLHTDLRNRIWKIVQVCVKFTQLTARLIYALLSIPPQTHFALLLLGESRALHARGCRQRRRCKQDGHTVQPVVYILRCQ